MVRVAQSRDLHHLRSALRAEATMMNLKVVCKARELGQRLNHSQFWKVLGVTLVEKDSAHSGGHLHSSLGRFIFVKKSEHTLRKRFTAAHEAGHLLLSRLSVTNPDFLSAKSEEKICNEFASELLIPRPLLRETLEKCQKLTSQLIIELCRNFRVNLQPMLIAIDQIGKFTDKIVVIAKKRGHPQRPEEIDYRIIATPIRGLTFLPTFQRLQSLGLGDLVEVLSSASPGIAHTGRSKLLRFPLWSKRVGNGEACGPANWEALRLAGGELIVLIETNDLSYQWNKPGSS